MEEKTKFKFDVGSVLRILSDDIYDSPLSLLRENVQNAFDAILMRCHFDPSFAGKGIIRVSINDDELCISDNGIGMTRKNLDDNYWTAGSSGKNTSDAKAAGVVGTFGIGAMANFGVCSFLEVTTRFYRDNETTLTSYVTRDELYNGEQSINISDSKNFLEQPGTTVKVKLLPNFSVNASQIIEYLSPYVKYLSVPVFINEQMISQKAYSIDENKNDKFIFNKDLHARNGIGFTYKIKLTRGTNSQPSIYLTDLKYCDRSIAGDMLLDYSMPSLFGYRNGFGLAAIPIATSFNLGGIANIRELVPTAGRDAISRESISMVASFVREAEFVIANTLSRYEEADSCRNFLKYIRHNNFIHLGDNITIAVANRKERVKLKDLAPEYNGVSLRYYLGNDESIINNSSDSNNWVLLPSDDSFRRFIQMAYLSNKHIEQISDNPRTLNIYEIKELETYEYAIKYRIEQVIKEDYLFADCQVSYADLSHGLTAMAKMQNNTLCLFIKRGTKELDYLRTLYSDNYGILEPMIKDLVRTQLYSKFAPYIPSSQRGGADMLCKMLMQKKEEWTVQSYEIGAVESIWDAYVNGKAEISDVLAVVKRTTELQSQIVEANTIGNISEVMGEQVIQNIISTKVDSPASEIVACPPILRMDKVTDCKILHSDNESHRINGFGSFLAVTDSMRDYALDFFLQPHTTRVIWSMHKLIYIFTHISGDLTLYYDMELKQRLNGNSTGGRAIISSTIITKDKVFIPIVPEIESYFNFDTGSRKFLVRYDKMMQ